MAHETVYNVHLAGLLRQQGLDAEAEVLAEGERIDVLVKVGGVRVAVEAKIGNRRAALADAEERLDQDLADAAVAVSYPVLERPREMTRLDAAPAFGKWRETDAEGLARLVRVVAGEAGDVDAIVKVFRRSLEQAASRLTDEQADRAVTAVNIPLPSKEDIRKNPKARDHPRLRLALLVASAALFHANLDGLNLRRPGKDARDGTRYQGGWPPQTLRECLDDPAPPDALIDAWETILALDYKPVFESAVNVLRALPPGAATAGFAKKAGAAGLRAASSLGGQRHDLLGRVFHWILSTATPTGAFYTSDAAATLLAGLAVRPEDAARFPNFTAVDPACGTGTLLVAAAKQLEHLNPGEAGGETGGKALIEDVLRGYDIEASAVQLAAVALGLMNPKVKFRQMGIHHLRYGTDPGGTGVAGSLELYGRTATVNMLVPASAQVDTGEAQILEAERHDLVIMNPPFTRSSARHDHLGQQAERAVKEREDELFRDAPVTRESGSGMFLLLGDQLCGEEAGTMAAVLPTSQFSRTEQAQKPWRHLLERFWLEMVVTSHDPGRYCFSENTPVSESLVVLRRLNDDNKNLPTRFINLAHNPGRPSGALAAAKAINNGDPEAVVWPKRRVEECDWTPVKFLAPYLTKTATEWFADGRLGCVPLGTKAEVGPAGRRVRDTYAVTSLRHQDEHGRVGIWYNNQDKPVANNAPPKWSMRVQPDCSLIRKKSHETLADKYWKEGRANLFLPDKFRTGTARTFMVRATEPALGNGWVSVKPRALENPEDWEEAMCAYLNSTVGVLAQTWASNPKVFGRPDMRLVGMRNIPVPDFTEDQTARLARVFEEMADRELMRFRDAEQDPVRKQLDRSVCEALGWDLGEVEKARRALCREPSVTGKPAG